MRGEHWTRDELILTLSYYFRIPRSKIVANNPDIGFLSQVLGRSVGAVSRKLLNFISLDSELRAQGVRGFDHGSKLDAEIWKEFEGRFEELAYESDLALERLKRQVSPEMVINLPTGQTEKERVMKTRSVQGFFRDMILGNYGKKCSFCDLAIEQLLIASHIVPWKDDENRRVNPTNGICLCVLHDKAFDAGFLSIDSDLKVIVSSEVNRENPPALHRIGLLAIEGVSISLPYRYPPAPYALEYHRENIFKP